jgi:hypothetical protein
MRARSPNDAMGGDTELPTTKITIGMKLDPKRILCPWARKQILRRAIKETRAIKARSANRMKWKLDARLPTHNKDQIRQKMFVVDNAYEVEVCGILPYNMQLMGMVSNQCYIPGVPGAASPTTYYAVVLFRAVLNDDRGNKVAFIPYDQKFLFPEHSVLKYRLV